jgi:glycosyltransferase involved in cell wall biosynthesis
MVKKKVLIMVPAFNEGRIIRRVVGEIEKLYTQFDLVVINDGSSDNTQNEAEATGARVLNLPYNLGIGGAVQTGFRIAYEGNYDAAIQIDGDAQHDPSFLMSVLNPVLANELDLCIGSRFLSNRTIFKSTFARRIGIRFFSLLLGLMTKTKLTDPTSGFRATGKKLIGQFANYYPVDFPEPEAIKIANRLGARIGEVPVNMRKRLGGQSSIRYWSTAYYMFKVTFAIFIDALKKRGSTP